MSADPCPCGETERIYFEALLSVASGRHCFAVGRRTWDRLRQYAEWKDRQPAPPVPVLGIPSEVMP